MIFGLYVDLQDIAVERTESLKKWLNEQLEGAAYTLESASADASFRHYFRIRVDDGRSLIVMDAPPEHENIHPWIHVAELFSALGVNVPRIYGSDPAQGFLLQSDLGNVTYLQVLTNDNAHGLYADALGALAAIQAGSRPGVLPEYSRELLMRELQLFPQWYIEKHKGISLSPEESAALEKSFDALLAVNLGEPRVFVHRDYHSRNLMCHPGSASPGVIDFQDAVYGPLSYDLVSLLKDAYISWDEEFMLDLLARYWEAAKRLGLPVRHDFARFHVEFEWMGIQRHLKVIGIFCRLNYRDGKAQYMNEIPRLLHYLRQSCRRYRELAPLIKLLDRLDSPEDLQYGYTF